MEGRRTKEPKVQSGSGGSQQIIVMICPYFRKACENLDAFC